MSKTGENILSELEFAFLDQPSNENSVQASNGRIIRLDKSLWNASPVLKRHSAKGVSYAVLNVPQSSLLALLDAHRRGHYPRNFADFLNLLGLICELELQELTHECADVLFKMDDFIYSDYPPECSSKTALQCFKLLLDSPLRTAKIYREQLVRISEHCYNNRDVMNKAMNLIKQKVKQFSGIGLEGIPVDFHKRVLPIAVYNRSGKLQTAIFDGNHLTPVDLFGKHFNWDSDKIGDNFYLKYGSYVLYRSESVVKRQNLQRAGEPMEVLKGCILFLTRKHFVFAVQHEGNRYSVLKWFDDERFVQIYQTTERIDLIDFEHEGRLLAIKLSQKSLLLFTWSTKNTLILLDSREIPQITSLVLTPKVIFLVITTYDEKLRFTRNRVEAYPLLSTAEVLLQRNAVLPGQGLSDFGAMPFLPYGGRERLNELLEVSEGGVHQLMGVVGEIFEFGGSQFTIKASNGNFFLVNSEGLHLVKGFPYSNKPKILATGGECHALSELSMTP